MRRSRVAAATGAFLALVAGVDGCGISGPITPADDDDTDTGGNPCDIKQIEDDPDGLSAAAGQLQAFHRSGQTFITWPEDTGASGETYCVYRSNVPITAANLASAQQLARVPEGSSYYVNEVAIGDPYQSHFVIEDLGPPLPDGVGLHVHTTRESGPGTFYYAVTELKGGVEQPLQSTMTLAAGVTEQVSMPQPVRVYTNGVKTLYTHWMDYAAWNPAFEGYAYNFWAGIPKGGNTTPLPLQMHLHAYGESWMRNWEEGDPYGSGTPFNLPAVWIEPDDHRNTWWYGFGNNVSLGEPPDTSSIIVNYTEQRLLYYLSWITSPTSGYLIDTDRMYLYGGSMGGSGALSFGLRHPERFAGIYALVPMTDEASSTWGRAGLDALWGTIAQNLPTNDGIGVHDRLDTRQYLLEHSASVPYTVSLHGRQDTTIEWSTQGLPWVEAGADAFAPGPRMWSESDHSNTWDIYLEAPIPNYPFSGFTLRRAESYLVFTAGPGDDDPNGSIPSCRGYGTYAYGYAGASVEWASSANPFMGFAAPEDTGSSWKTALRIRTDECGWPTSGTVTATLHRAQRFKPAAGSRVSWENRSAEGQVLQSGATTVGTNGLVTLDGVQVTTTGSILELKAAESGGDDGGDDGGGTGDADRDGVTAAAGDCNDADATTYPGAAETCDVVDNNCDGRIDEGLNVTWYYDADADGYGADSSLEACAAPAGYVAVSGDCNDLDAGANPAASEVCDGRDNDCNGKIDDSG